VTTIVHCCSLLVSPADVTQIQKFNGSLSKQLSLNTQILPGINLSSCFPVSNVVKIFRKSGLPCQSDDGSRYVSRNMFSSEIVQLKRFGSD
jgi:hypothetical protein